MNVPVEATRKARKGTVRARKDGYRLLAATTLAAPSPVPMRPPIEPPLIVALHLCQNLGLESILVRPDLLVMRLLLFFRKDLHIATVWFSNMCRGRK